MLDCDVSSQDRFYCSSVKVDHLAFLTFYRNYIPFLCFFNQGGDVWWPSSTDVDKCVSLPPFFSKINNQLHFHPIWTLIVVYITDNNGGVFLRPHNRALLWACTFGCTVWTGGGWAHSRRGDVTASPNCLESACEKVQYPVSSSESWTEELRVFVA